MINLCEYVWELIPSTVTPRFVGQMPTLSTEGVSMEDYNGGINTTYLGMPETIFKPILRFFIRTKDYTQGKSFAQAIQNALHEYTDESLLGILAVGSPGYLGKSAEKLHEFQLMYQVTLKE